MKTRQEKAYVLLVTVVLIFSAAVRWSYYQEIKDTNYFQVPLLDSFFYHEWAEQILDRQEGRSPYWMGPLYPHTLAVQYWLFGRESPAPQLIQWLISLIGIAVMARIAWRLTPPAVAAVAVLLYAFYGPPAFYAGFKLMVSMLTLIYLICIWQTIRALDRPTWRRWFGLGLLIGLCGLGRGNMLIFLFAAPLLLLGSQMSRSRRWRLTAVLIAGGVLMILPITVRNWVVGGDLVLLTSNGGINLYIGQQARYGGIFGPVEPVPEVEYDPTGELLLEMEMGRDLRPSEVSRIYALRGIKMALARPGVTLLHYARKAYRFWNGYELPQLAAFDYRRARSPALRWLFVPYTLLSAAGLLGLLIMRGRSQQVLALFVLVYFLSLLPFFPTARYRLPIAPLLAISAAAFLVATIESFGRGLRRVGLRNVTALALLILALWPRWARLEPAHVEWQLHMHDATRAAKQGDRESTLAAVQLAEDTLPGYAGTYCRLAFFLKDFGDLEGELQAYQMAEKLLPRERLLPYLTGRSLHKLDRLDEAMAEFERCAALDPAWSRPYFGMAMVHRDRGEFTAAIAKMSKAVELNPGAVFYRNNLASLYAESGQMETARDTFSELVQIYPDYARGWINLALAEQNLGRPQQAHAALAHAGRVRHLDEESAAMIRQLQGNWGLGGQGGRP